MIVLNLFFVYFSMLRGLQRGLDWQRLYCIACIIQLLVEVLLYETSECAMVNFFIPNLARTEVQGVTFAIYQAIQSICSSNNFDMKIPILDAPRYLFLSTRLAERFPNLLESVIVRSYHSYSPGELSRKWKISHSTNFDSFSLFDWNSRSRVGSRVRRVTFTSLIISFLQYIGSVSISVQRFFIHALQPLLVAAIAYLFALIYNNPLYLLIFVPLLGYWCYELWDRWYSEERSVEDVVVPMVDLKEKNNNNNNNNDNNNNKQNSQLQEINTNLNQNININENINQSGDLSKSLNLPNTNLINNNTNNTNNKNDTNNTIKSINHKNISSESESDSISNRSHHYSESGRDENNSRRYSNFSFKSESYESYDQQISDDCYSLESSINNIYDDDDNSSHYHKQKYLQSVSSDDVNFEFDTHFEIHSSHEEDE